MQGVDSRHPTGRAVLKLMIVATGCLGVLAGPALAFTPGTWTAKYSSCTRLAKPLGTAFVQPTCSDRIITATVSSSGAISGTSYDAAHPHEATTLDNQYSSLNGNSITVHSTYRFTSSGRGCSAELLSPMEAHLVYTRRSITCTFQPSGVEKSTFGRPERPSQGKQVNSCEGSSQCVDITTQPSGFCNAGQSARQRNYARLKDTVGCPQSGTIKYRAPSGSVGIWEVDNKNKSFVDWTCGGQIVVTSLTFKCPSQRR